MAPGTHIANQISCRKIDPVIASALLDAGLNHSQVADKLQVHQSTISRFASKYSDNQAIKQDVQVFNDSLHSLLTETMAESAYTIHRGLQYFNRLDDDSFSALPASVKTATINSANVAFGIAFDKDRLVQGLSTINVDLHAEYQALKGLQDAKEQLQTVCSGSVPCQDRDTESD